MADRGASATGDYPFRFFSPEQIDQILREGVKRGRPGSHAAIERILKHEPGLGRANLWQRIRRLKQASNGKPYQRTFWSSEDDQILQKGYQAGWEGKREAIVELRKRHPAWRPHTIWRRAAKLGLVRTIAKRSRERSRQPWTENDDRILLNLAGYKTAQFVAKILHRSEAAIRYRLALLGKSSRVHLEGYSRRALAQEMHLGSRTVQRFIAEGLLEVRDPRITRTSLEDLCKAGRLKCPPNEEQLETQEAATSSRAPDITGRPLDNASDVAQSSFMKPPRSSRAKRIWAEVADQFKVSPAVIEQFISKGLLKLYDPRITERSLRSFCARYGAMINVDSLDAETRAWLLDSMNLALNSGKGVARRSEAFRKHARVVRTCERCGRAVRGNVFFRHIRRCTAVGSTSS